jgi:hypothetical protein
MTTAYQHGIYGNTAATVMPPATVATAGIQCVIGTAPVNMLANPQVAVNVPILLNNLGDAQNLLAYNSNMSLDTYTIGQSIHATFEVFDTAPLIAINVLNPTTHTTAKTSAGSMVGGNYIPGTTVGSVFTPDIGILLAGLEVKNTGGTITYILGTDYTTSWNSNGSLNVSVITGGALTATSSVSLTYSILDPTKVVAADIIAGIALINRAFQTLSTPTSAIIPATILAPGWSQLPTVGQALIAAAPTVSTVFHATAVLDIDSATATTITAAIAWKVTNSYISRDAIVCYPKVETNQGKIIWQSAMAAALMQANDAANESTPFVSPSNKAYNILTTILGDNVTQVVYMLSEANQLNGEGIFTALNFMGWKSWGDNTSIFSWSAEQAGSVYDPKDQFINIKRSFDWQNNRFICSYWSAIDNPMNYRAIQTLITDENQFYNPFITTGLVAGMSIQFNQANNPQSQILAGVIQFEQYLSPYIPTQTIINTLQFNPAMLATALGGAA